MATCPVPWCGQNLLEGTRHPDHERIMKEIAQGRVVFLAVRNPDGSVDVTRWEKA